MPDVTLRLTTDASLTAILEERPFFLDDAVTLLLGPDETVPSAVGRGRPPLHRGDDRATGATGCAGSRSRSSGRSAVIRAAITLQQNAYDDTGAIVAAMTTSIPEAPDSRPQLGLPLLLAARRLLRRRRAEPARRDRDDGALPRLHRQHRRRRRRRAAAARLPDQRRARARRARSSTSLPGYRGMGPVRVGNDAYRQVQHDVYGSAILAATHVFFDERLVQPRRRRAVRAARGARPARASRCYDQPDAGLWELRGSARVHTFSSVMCWAACDRLARIATRLGLAERAQAWRDDADAHPRASSTSAAGTRSAARFVATVDGDALDASLLLLAELGFVAPDDPRFAGTVARDRARAEARRLHLPLRRARRLRRAGERVRRLHVLVRQRAGGASAAATRRARCSSACSRCRNRHGLLAEHLDPATGELWGNFVQTYSMVGLITVGDPAVDALGRGVLVY